MQRHRVRADADEEELPVLTEEGVERPSAAELIRREARGARMVATAALVLSTVAVLTMIVLAVRIQRGPVPASPSASVGLATVEVGSEFDQDVSAENVEGWYRTYLNTVVRESPELESQRVGVLPSGKAVYVLEKRGRRVRIESPLVGWMSMETTDGVKILRRDLSAANRFNRSALNKVFQSDEARATHAQMEKTAAQFTALESRLIDSLKLINERIVQSGDHPFETATHAVGKQIGHMAEQVKSEAVDTSKNLVEAANERSKDVKAILQDKLKVQVPKNFHI